MRIQLHLHFHGFPASGVCNIIKGCGLVKSKPRTSPGYWPRRQATCPIARRCPGRGSAVKPNGFYSLRRAAHSAHDALPAAFRCINPYLQVFTCIRPPQHHGITLRTHVSLHFSEGLWASLGCCFWQRPAPRAILAPTAAQHNNPGHCSCVC